MAHKTNRRPEPTLKLELKLSPTGRTLIAGLDEAGRGAWAGPVTAAAVVLPLHLPDLSEQLFGVRDSKLMTPRQRKFWVVCIQELALGSAIGEVSPSEVDDLGVIGATRLAMIRALSALPLKPDHLLIDYLVLPELGTPQTSLPRGDATSMSIAAASVVAKTSRDHNMCQLDKVHPGYGFAAHKGYGTPQHRAALQHLGPCAIHRRSFSPVAACSSYAI
ncbi:MAG: ribonuclease HII [Anaerolineales bacterium]